MYLTAPFIPSWSLFEAMASGALVVGSRTAPVEELIDDGHNGLLTDFFDHHPLAELLDGVLEESAQDPTRLLGLRAAARQTIVDRYALADLLPRQLRLLDDVVAGRPPRQVEASVAGRLIAPRRLQMTP